MSRLTLPRPPRFAPGALLFSLNTFTAAMLALGIGFALGMPRPYWAMTTAYIVSQPLSGAVRSKALYRVLGTILGAAAAVALVPNLANAPVLLSLALALWVGGCLTISLLDRTPRSYLLMLAGYTAAIIGFPSVGQPGAIFDVAISRVTEIGLGILCATVVHSLVFPRPVGEALRLRLADWLAQADRWALDILDARDPATVAGDRWRLAGAAAEIQLLATHLPFDTSRLRETTAAVRALQDQMLLLIPLLSGTYDRLTALAHTTDPQVRAAIDAVAAWIRAGAPPQAAAALSERLQALAEARAACDWDRLLTESLLARLADVVAALAAAHALLAHLDQPDAALAPQAEAAIAQARRRPSPADLPLATLSGAAATLAILVSCAAWILGGWGDGAAAAVMTAVFCCFFAALDDPIPGIVNFGLFSLLSLPLAALYMFAILPAIDGYPMLVLALAPALIPIGLFAADPRHAGGAMATIMGFCNALALQDDFTADFAGFLNGNLGQFVGLFVAIFVTAALRSMGTEAAAQRLLSRTWKSIARLARDRGAPEPADFASRLVTSLGLLAPRLAAFGAEAGDATAVEALRDLRVGMNLAAAQQLRQRLNGAPRAAMDTVLAGVADHFAARSAGREPHDDGRLLADLDQALDLAARHRAVAGPGGVTGLVGLRRNLFPTAPAFAPRLETSEAPS
ncbi:FUSC family protein [Caulobacter sp. KR2-114]|uniref:FUSC family protein n=1 Tax=Caulobacter sp. KR2-114 TaxID=3400912 RepID=UPI003C07EC18